MKKEDTEKKRRKKEKGKKSRPLTNKAYKENKLNNKIKIKHRLVLFFNCQGCIVIQCSMFHIYVRMHKKKSYHIKTCQLLCSSPTPTPDVTQPLPTPTPDTPTQWQGPCKHVQPWSFRMLAVSFFLKFLLYTCSVK